MKIYPWDEYPEMKVIVCVCEVHVIEQYSDIAEKISDGTRGTFRASAAV